MLHLVYGDIDEFNKVYDTEYVTLYRINDHFDNLYTHEWLNNKFAKKVIQEVDKSEHIKDDLIISPVFKAMPPRMLSGGAKTLITLYNENKFQGKQLMILGSHMGDNCTPLLAELSMQKDVWINLRHFMEFDSNLQINAIIENDKTKYSNTDDLNIGLITAESKWDKYIVDTYGMLI